MISPGCGLTTLDLRQNSKLGDAGATAFGACLGSGLGQHLTSLHLGWCGIGPKGCKALADGIRRAHTCRASTGADAGAGAATGTGTATAPSSSSSSSSSKASQKGGHSNALVVEGVVRPLVAPSVSPGLGLQHLDLSGNWIEGNKPKSDDKYKEQVGSALLKVSGVLAKARGRVGGDDNAVVGGVFSAADQFLSRGHKTLAPQKRSTGAGGSGALARLLRCRCSASSPSSSSSGGGGATVPSPGFLLRLAGCGLEVRHMKLLGKAAAAANAANVFAAGGEKDSDEIAATSAAVVLDLRLNVMEKNKTDKTKKANADFSSSDDESREAWVNLEGSDDENDASSEVPGGNDDDEESLSGEDNEEDGDEDTEDEVVTEEIVSDFQSDVDDFSDGYDQSGDYDEDGSDIDEK